MIKLSQQKHLICFDHLQQCLSSFQFQIVSSQLQQSGDQPTCPKQEECVRIHSIHFKIQHQFIFEWDSNYYDLQIQETEETEFGKIPFSLETYLQKYNNPGHWKVNLVPKSNTKLKKLKSGVIGKLLIKTSFRGNPLVLPVSCVNRRCSKRIKVVINANDNDEVFCSGKKLQLALVRKAQIYQASQYENTNKGFEIYEFEADERLECCHICIMKGKFKKRMMRVQGRLMTILDPKNREQVMVDGIQENIKMYKHMDDEIIIVNNVETRIECHKIIFNTGYSDLGDKVYRSFLFTKICDRWIIEGMVGIRDESFEYNQCLNKLVSLIKQGEELYPLCNPQYWFDKVWKLRAICVLSTLSNLLQTNLTQLLLSYSCQQKLTTALIFRNIGQLFEIDKLKTIYEYQFINSIGLNQIQYRVDFPKYRKPTVILKQKSVLTSIIQDYNKYRIQLLQFFEVSSSIMSHIHQNNNLSMKGPLAFPEFIKCIPYFVGDISLQMQNNCLHIQHLNEQTVTQSEIDWRNKRGTQKRGEQVCSFMLLDKDCLFPALFRYKGLSECEVLKLLMKVYSSERQELKVLNTISLEDCKDLIPMCEVLLEKADFHNEGTGKRAKTKILQMVGQLLNRSEQVWLWQKYIDLMGYIEVVDNRSEQMCLYANSLLKSIGLLEYRIQMSHYFEQIHKILLQFSKYFVNTENYSYQNSHILFIKAITKWQSKYSIIILQEISSLLELCITNCHHYQQLINTIIECTLPYLIKLDLKKSIVSLIHQQIQTCIQQYLPSAIPYFKHQILVKQQHMGPIQFISSVFSELEHIKAHRFQIYGACLQVFKNVLNRKRKVYGFSLQLEIMNEHQNYFIAEYMWKNLCSKEAIHYPEVRLQWIKIYRIFYFYYTPISTFSQLMNNKKHNNFGIEQEERKQIMKNMMDFVPDIRWFSNYDSDTEFNIQTEEEQPIYREIIVNADNDE